MKAEGQPDDVCEVLSKDPQSQPQSPVIQHTQQEHSLNPVTHSKLNRDIKQQDRLLLVTGLLLCVVLLPMPGAPKSVFGGCGVLWDDLDTLVVDEVGGDCTHRQDGKADGKRNTRMHPNINASLGINA